MASWDRRGPAASARARDAALREQLRDAIVPFSPYWGALLDDLGIRVETIRRVADLARLPAVGERDVCPDGDPAGMAGCHQIAMEEVEVGAGRGTARVSPSRRLQRPSALPCAAPAVAGRIVDLGGQTPHGSAGPRSRLNRRFGLSRGLA